MALAEFDLIARYFKAPTKRHDTTQLGIGDDCAVLRVPAGFELALTTDTMVEQIHFLAGTDPEALGHKLLAVNLSDLASMGAQPLAVMLALTLPKADASWLAAFARGFLALAERYQVDLIGGDTTQGPLTLTVQAIGLLPIGQALKRSTAQIGDIVCVTGNLGDAGLGLKIAQGNYAAMHTEEALIRFNRPEPRVLDGLALSGIASAAIDISDGLVADLGHIAQQSGVGIELSYEHLALSPAVQRYISSTDDWQMPLLAGDDYELGFTISQENLGKLNRPYVQIGRVIEGNGVVVYKEGIQQILTGRGYEHFSN